MAREIDKLADMLAGLGGIVVALYDSMEEDAQARFLAKIEREYAEMSSQEQRSAAGTIFNNFITALRPGGTGTPRIIH